jgi:transporter family-2 protein
MRLASVPFMLLAGGLIALQSRINGELAHQLGDGMRAGAFAATWSFGSAFIVLTVASGTEFLSCVAQLAMAG